MLAIREEAAPRMPTSTRKVAPVRRTSSSGLLHRLPEVRLWSDRCHVFAAMGTTAAGAPD